MSDTAIEFSHVSHRFGSQRVLNDVTFRIEKGENVGVIGANGGGKTVLLRLALGLLSPTEGCVTIFGERPEIGCRRIGYVPQAMRFDPMFPVTSLDIVLMARLDRVKIGFFDRRDREIAREALAEVGLAEVADKRFAKLSGGQRQRVLIARALACEPDFLLLDEPTANIDLAVEAQFVETLEKLRERLGILMVTHDIGLLEHLGDRVLCVNKTVHWHHVDDLKGDLLREVYSGEMRREHDVAARHEQDDHTKCDHAH